MIQQRLAEEPPARAWEQDGLPVSALVLLFFISLLLVFSRRPGDLLHAQFYAEDGMRWFAQAYNLHWLRSLLIPDASYLQVLPRLFAGIALVVPLQSAPLVLNLAGAALQALPVVALLSRRCSTWGPLPARLAMTAVYLASPNVHEIHVNITNAQWHFGLLQILLAFGHAPGTRTGKALDVAIFTLGSVSGPFDLVLLPILLLSWWGKRDRWTLVLAACLAVGSLAQLVTLTGTFALPWVKALAPESARVRLSHVPLGATPSLLLRIVGDGVYLDSMLGYSKLDRGSLLIPALAFLVGGVVTICGLWWCPRPFHYFALYAVLLFLAAIKSPVIDDPVSRWHALSIDPGMRYYFLPMLVFLWSAIYAVQSAPTKLLRYVCLFPLALFLLGLRQWKYEALPPSHLPQYAQMLDDASPGQTVVIPITPKPWKMTLIKR